MWLLALPNVAQVGFSSSAPEHLPYPVKPITSGTQKSFQHERELLPVPPGPHSALTMIMAVITY